MGSNQLPTNAGQLIGLGNKMLAGLNSLGTTLGITQVTPAALQAQIAAFANADGEFNAARSDQQVASDAFHTEEDALAGWLGVVRNILAGRFGNRWSTMWAQAGFVNHSTAVPSRIEDRIALALQLAGFFTANPGYEVPTMEVTAAKATALYNAASSTQQAFITASVALKTKGDADTSAFDTLTATMRALINILTATLAKDDPRWGAFGLTMPATNSTPGAPLNLTATMNDVGDIVVACDATPLATRYRWRMRIVDVDKDYLLVAGSVDPIATIAGVLPGQTVQIIVQAVNVTMQGVASEPLTYTVPVVAKAVPEAKRVSSPTEAERPGNGNGNGHRHEAVALRG